MKFKYAGKANNAKAKKNIKLLFAQTFAINNFLDNSTSIIAAIAKTTIPNISKVNESFNIILKLFDINFSLLNALDKTPPDIAAKKYPANSGNIWKNIIAVLQDKNEKVENKAESVNLALTDWANAAANIEPFNEIRKTAPDP